MQVELGNDATYLVTEMVFVSVCLTSGDILELDVLRIIARTRTSALVQCECARSSSRYC
jgi:hypothetical protein